MELRHGIVNYRCFAPAEPAELVLRPGIIAIVGSNNSGKSALRQAWRGQRLTGANDPSLRGRANRLGPARTY